MQLSSVLLHLLTHDWSFTQSGFLSHVFHCVQHAPVQHSWHLSFGSVTLVRAHAFAVVPASFDGAPASATLSASASPAPASFVFLGESNFGPPSANPGSVALLSPSKKPVLEAPEHAKRPMHVTRT